MNNVPIGTFPIPAQEADLNALASHLADVTAQHGQVIGDMQSAMVNVLTPIQQQMDALQTRIKRGISATVRPINQGYESVLGDLLQNTMGTISEIGVQTNLINSMLPTAPNVPSGGPLSASQLYTWLIFIDCQGRQVGALPETFQQQIQAAIQGGWQRTNDPPVGPVSAAMIAGYMKRNIPAYTQLCQG